MRQLYSLLGICLFFSCQALIDAPIPNLYWDKFEATGTKNVQPQMYTKLEGVYKLSIADDDFGDSAIVKWTYDITGKDTSHYLSIFCKEDVRYFILQGRSSGDSILLNGYWRNIENTKTGKAQFIISNRNGGFALLTGATATSPVILKGHYGMFEDSPQKGVNLQFDRPLKMPPPFQIIAHRGGGRNNDLLPASENSLEMIHLASRLGANGIEIDVHLSGHSHNFEQYQVKGKDFLVIGGGGGLHQPLKTGAGLLDDMASDYKPEFHYLTVKRCADGLQIKSYQLMKDFSGFEEGRNMVILRDKSPEAELASAGSN